MYKIKQAVTTTMFSTGASLVILGVFLVLFDTTLPYVPVVFEIFAANVVINLGIWLLTKLESPNVILEYLRNIGYIIAVLVVFGLIFDWYSTIPVWVLVIMAVVIYLFVIIITITKIRKDTNEINELLQKRKEKIDDTAS
jgi:hypothetical protein